MARDPKYDILFEPIQIGPKILKNRFWQVPQCNGWGTAKPGQHAYHRMLKAEGGWAACCTEVASIHPEAAHDPMIETTVWDDDDVANLAAMCERIHAHGALAGIELSHDGVSSRNLESRATPRGPSQIPAPYDLNIHPRNMDIRDIKLVQRMFLDATLRAREAGFDIIYVYAAHENLVYQFLSPFFNKRTDAYGGTFENRVRLYRELLELTREAVGDDCAIASRLGLDGLRGPSSIEPDEGLRVMEYLDDLVDVWDIGNGTLMEWGQMTGASRFYPENNEAELLLHIHAGDHTNKPVIGVGRFTSPDTMVDAIKRRQLDIIGAARPAIADPFLPKKIEEGRLDDIRECIGCNQCVAHFNRGGAVVCTQNATVGEEYRRGWHPERYHPAANADEGVLIVGAGPAGMECAVTLGRRKMSAVHLVEKTAEIGGSLNWVSKLGFSDGVQNGAWGSGRGLGEWRRVIDYRETQLAKLRNVELHVKSELTADDVRSYGADIVVVATGCRFATDGLNYYTHAPIPGADGTCQWQLTPDEVVLGTKPIGQRVLVFETEAYFFGASIAQKLAGEGKDVTLVTPAGKIAGWLEYTLEHTMMMKELYRLGVEMHPLTMVERIDPGVCHAVNVYHGELTRTFEFDTLVLCTQRLSNDEMFWDLRADEQRLASEGIRGVYLIGDASAPMMMYEAVFDGHRLAREIDAPDPSMPLPFVREHGHWLPARDSAHRRIIGDRSDVPEPAMVGGIGSGAMQGVAS